MAIREPSDADEVDGAFGGLSDAQFGALAEERLASAILLQAPRAATVAVPLLDLGFDLYLRRIRTLRVNPIQVKARSFLYADRLFQASVSSLHLDPNAYVVLPYVPPPDWHLKSQLWAVPVPAFVKLARPHDGGYVFSGHLDDRVDEPAAEFLVDVDQMERQWLAKIPRWSESSAGPALITAPPRDEVPRPASQALGKYGELWLASQLVRSGLEHVVVAHDRLRVDCVDMLLHELRSFAIAGVVVHTSSISMRGTAQFRIRRATFFVDSQLYVVLLVCSRDGTVQQTAFLIPSADISRIATSSTNRGEPIYQCSFRLDPLAEEMRPFAITSTQLGAAIIERLSAASSSTD